MFDAQSRLGKAELSLIPPPPPTLLFVGTRLFWVCPLRVFPCCVTVVIFQNKYKTSVKKKAERQIRAVKPSATEEELTAVFEQEVRCNMLRLNL